MMSYKYLTRRMWGLHQLFALTIYDWILNMFLATQLIHDSYIPCSRPKENFFFYFFFCWVKFKLADQIHDKTGFILESGLYQGFIDALIPYVQHNMVLSHVLKNLINDRSWSCLCVYIHMQSNLLPAPINLNLYLMWTGSQPECFGELPESCEGIPFY